MEDNGFDESALNKMSVRNRIGLIISVAYFFALIVLMIKRGEEILCLPLNELGDFAAGAFGPLAMLWLVLGYFQQGDELKQNTDALRLQAQELAKTVEQQQKLVAQGYVQIEAGKMKMEEDRLRINKAARPKFEFSIHRGAQVEQDTISLEIEARNVGALCSHVNVRTKYMSLCVYVLPKKNSPQSWLINASAPASEPFEVFDFYISYLDAAGNTGNQLVSVSTYADEDACQHIVHGEDDEQVWNHHVGVAS